MENLMLFEDFINKDYFFDENKLIELYHNTYVYNGIVDAIHLSTFKNLEVNKYFSELYTESINVRGGDGDYIYSSLEPNEWIETFKDEGKEIPLYSYNVRLFNPKYKKSSFSFGKYTPSQFLSKDDNIKILNKL